MKLFNILAVLITLSAVFSYINHRFIKLPTTIGVMAIALLGSTLVAVAAFYPSIASKTDGESQLSAP